MKREHFQYKNDSIASVAKGSNKTKKSSLVFGLVYGTTKEYGTYCPFLSLSSESCRSKSFRLFDCSAFRLKNKRNEKKKNKKIENYFYRFHLLKRRRKDDLSYSSIAWEKFMHLYDRKSEKWNKIGCGFRSIHIR